MDLSFIHTPDFDEETHTYRVDGIVRPGVTGILKGAGLSDAAVTESGWTIDEAVLENAAERGKYSDLAIELDARGELDEDTVGEDIYPYLDAWRDFVADTGYVSIANQLLFYNEEFDYCGGIDDVGYIGDELTIIDRKTGSVGLKFWHAFQLAGYARIFVKDGKWPHRMMVHLRPELKRKKYSPFHFSAESASWDWEVFKSARTILTAKELGRKH